MSEAIPRSPALSRGVSALARSPRDVGVVTHEHPSDPLRPQVKVPLDRLGEPVQTPPLVNTWERDGRGNVPHAVVEAVDPDVVRLDPRVYI